MTIASVQADHFRVPLPVALSDSTHGTMEAFELITVRVRDADGAEGLGYTYTVGAGGRAIRDLIARDLGPALAGADHFRRRVERAGWSDRVHYVGRGGTLPLPVRPAAQGAEKRTGGTAGKKEER